MKRASKIDSECPTCGADAGEPCEGRSADNPTDARYCPERSAPKRPTDTEIAAEMQQYVATFARFGVRVTGCRPEGCPHDRGHKTIAAYRRCRDSSHKVTP